MTAVGRSEGYKDTISNVVNRLARLTVAIYSETFGGFRSEEVYLLQDQTDNIPLLLFNENIQVQNITISTL